MATRPIFLPIDPWPYVKQLEISFRWHAGFAKTQAQKSIDELHKSAAQRGISPILEISSKSKSQLGVRLSAFNLILPTQSGEMSVECAFQGSKVFESGGPYTDLYAKTSWEAKRDPRLSESGNLTGFSFLGLEFPTEPQTAFYDWLYINALRQHPELANEVVSYKGFSDIAFSPKKSINCQARSAALFTSLRKNALLHLAVQSQESYLQLISSPHRNPDVPHQLGFQFDEQ